MKPSTKEALGISGLILGAIAIIFILSSIGTVSAGFRGVYTRFGATTGTTVQPGIYLKWPLIDRVYKMDVRIQKEQVDAEAASKDLQDVKSTVALNYHVDPIKVVNLFQNVGRDYNDTIIAPAMQEAVKATTANFTAEELIEKRADVSQAIKDSLALKLASVGLIPDSFNIVNFNFSESFNSAIESKVTAQQQSLAAQNLLAKVKFEAQQAVEAAQGKAKAIQIEGDAIAKNPLIIQMRSIEKWNGNLPQVTGSGAVPFVNIPQSK